MMNQQFKLKLRKLSHQLDPVVTVGSNELTEAVQAEIDRSLDAHELIKIRINARDKEHRQQMT